ncbi:lipase [Halteromyces radiatus]|uniref:lipase n=1 Tax=Halteromyces radiatus TaxID=101107 RepID=UPI002220EE2E|nr:lipase [Halteromyces radiatus]KAI8086602.1 lipase [Halteromyces radiatus]
MVSSSSLLILLFCVFQATSAANATVPFKLPSLIADRTKMPHVLPNIPLDLEEKAMQINGPLPKEEPSKYGLALNATMDPLASPYHLEARDENTSIASRSTVAVLKKHASLAFISYCRAVVPGGKWPDKLSSCPTCLDHTSVQMIAPIVSSDITDASGYVIRDDTQKTIYLVFRGTSSFGNILADFKFFLGDYPPVGNGAKVHRGFYQSYMKIQKQVLSVMTDQLTKYPKYRVTVTGHSLGGAYATLAALDLYQRDKRFNPKNMNIITFGEPRVGNPAFAAYGVSTKLEKKRVVHNRDVVSHLPLMKMGYLHFGTEHWLQKDQKTVKICQSDYELENCSNSIVPRTSLLDHTNYFYVDIDFCLFG